MLFVLLVCKHWIIALIYTVISYIFLKEGQLYWNGFKDIMVFFKVFYSKIIKQMFCTFQCIWEYIYTWCSFQRLQKCWHFGPDFCFIFIFIKSFLDNRLFQALPWVLVPDHRVITRFIVFGSFQLLIFERLDHVG